jgi:hypothetical protein
MILGSQARAQAFTHLAHISIFAQRKTAETRRSRRLRLPDALARGLLPASVASIAEAEG